MTSGLVFTAAVSSLWIGGLAVLAAVLSPVPFAERLRLVRPQWGAAGWVLAIVGGLALSEGADAFLQWTGLGRGETLEQLAAALREARGLTLVFAVLTIGLLYSVYVFRVARSVAMNIVVLEYVEAARLRGEGLFWIILREILPNALPPLAAEFGLRFCFAFLFVAALSFLGLGVQPPDADWGSMVKESALAIPAGIAAPLYPAAAIALLTIGVNLVVDWLLSIYSRPQGENA